MNVAHRFRMHIIHLAGALALLAALSACAPSGDATAAADAPVAKVAAAKPASGRTATAVFAGGCFWCMEPPFDKLPGVIETTSGYTGGQLANPTYEQVSAGGTGHAEALRVTYDPAQVDYVTLLDVFWHNIDPIAIDRQFCDRGDQYRSAIFVADGRQRGIAEKSKRDLQASGRFNQPIATEIVAAGPFWPAEEYHQDYYEKNPIRYKYYRYGCGRDQRLEHIWGTSNH